MYEFHTCTCTIISTKCIPVVVPLGVLATTTVFDHRWPVGLYGLQCKGNESSIWNCTYSTTNSGNCDQFEDASVFCQRN